jgi:NhaP-type Na+/H+ or K+/H+ antiporter
MCLSCFQVDIFNNSFGVKSCNCCVTETLQLSGILTILFSAITARRYINHNIPPEAQRASAFVFELIAYLAETSVFLYLGFDVFSSVQQQKSA